MPTAVACPKCQQRFAAPDELAGRKVKCPSCAAPIQIPAAGASPQTTPQHNMAPQQPAAPQQPGYGGYGQQPQAYGQGAQGPAVPHQPQAYGQPQPGYGQSAASSGGLDSFFDEELTREQQAMQQRQAAAMAAQPHGNDKKYCPSCQAEIPNAVSFCVMCGYGNPDNDRNSGGGGGGFGGGSGVTAGQVFFGIRIVLSIIRIIALIG